MTRAMGRFPGGVAPKTRAEREAVLATIDYRTDWLEWIRPIEDAYYALGDADLGRRIDAYVRSHPLQFFLDD